VSGLNKGLGKVQITLKWDPSPLGVADDDLDVVAAVYSGADPYGTPSYLVHFGSRSPDGTITLNRDSRNGQGFGADEVMTLELERMTPAYTRVVVGVAIQQRSGRKTFGDIANAAYQILEGHVELAGDDFTTVSGATGARVAEFLRGESGDWRLHTGIRGFDADPQIFTALMGRQD
jgi:tellurium resistance protein TerD